MRDTLEIHAPKADIWQVIAGKLVEVEQLEASRFVFVIAAGYLLLMGIALPFIHLGDDPRYRLPLFGLIGILAFARIVLGALLWIVSVRRRQHSVLLTASHVTLGIAIASLLEFLFQLTMESLGTNGRLIRSVVDSQWNALAGPILALLPIPFVFLGAVVLIAIGRRLIDG